MLSQATTEIVRDHLPPGVEVVELGRQALRGLTRPEYVFELRIGARDTTPGPNVDERRKTVTVLFAGVGASAAEGTKLDPEAHRRVISPCAMDMRAVVERHGGTVETYPGDALMAVFGVPVLHEDDALRAVRAAAEMREAVAESGDEAEDALGVRLTLRVGVGTGEVIAARPAAGQPLAAGEAVHAAMGLEELAGAAEILIDEETHRLVRSAVRAEHVGAPRPSERRHDRGPAPARNAARRQRARLGPRFSARGARPAAGDAVDGVRRSGKRPGLPPGDGARRGRRGKVAARPTSSPRASAPRGSW